MGLMSLLMGSRRTSPARRAKAPAPRFRPTLEDMESRLVLSHGGGMTVPIPDVVEVARPVQNQLVLSLSNILNIRSIRLNQIAQDAEGVITASGRLTANLLGRNIHVPFDLTLTPPDSADECPVLDLEIGALDLNLLGLRVQTSDICLTITANEEGGILGDLLCGLTDGIDLPLGSADAGAAASAINLDGLVDQLNDLLDNTEVLNAVNTLLGDLIDDALCIGNILHLELGPIDLSLLGLNVHLDDCEGGPVTVDISARGNGLAARLLDALCGLLDATEADATA